MNHSKKNVDGTEHLASVHNNPFVRKFGLPHHSVARQEPAESEPSILNLKDSEIGDDDEEQEYHVNSGFVNKLRSKFAQLENKSHKLSLSRKSASVENLLNLEHKSRDSLVSNSHKWQKDDSSVTASTAKVDLRKFAQAGYKPQIRGRIKSCDLETASTEKPVLAKRKDVELLRHNNIRSVKPPLPKKNIVPDPSSKTKRYSRNSGSENIVPKVEHHDWKVAPDLEKIARDDIVIIESIQPSVTVHTERNNSKSDANEDSPNGYRKVKSITEKECVHDENELPKPNTVSQFRTLFEKTHTTLDTLNVWRHQSPPPRKSSGTDTNSPVTTPRSPLVKMNDDNVFEDASKSSSSRDQAKLNSPRNSSNWDTNASISTRRRSSLTDYEQNVDKTSSQKSLAMFRKSSEEREKTMNVNRNSYTGSVDIEGTTNVNRNSYTGSLDNEGSTDVNRNSYTKKDSETNSIEASSPTVQSTLIPTHPLSKVFDSKYLVKKVEKPKRPKPPILANKHRPIPKDTIEMKHETDERNEQKLGWLHKRENLKLNLPEKTDESVPIESVIKPSKKTENISPRQTIIFDSNSIVKKNRDPPKAVLVSPLENVSNLLSNNVPKQVSIEIKDVDRTKMSNENGTDVAMEISPTRPLRKTEEKTVSGITEVKPKVIETANKPKPRKFKVKEQNFMKAQSVNETERAKPVVKTTNGENATPMTGMSSFLASRLIKTQPDQENQLKTSSVHLANGSSPSPVPRKRQAPDRPVNNGPSMDVDMLTSAPPLPATSEPSLPSTNIDDIFMRQRKKSSQSSQSATKLVFDSSKIVTKRKDPPKRKPPRKTLEQMNQAITFESESIVPKLDLSSITGDNLETEYQEGYIPTIIKPCFFKFAGACVTFQNSPYKKTQSRNVKISFDDHATTTFEYEPECEALKLYLEDHPDEREAAEKQDEAVNGTTESVSVNLLDDTPHPPSEPETHMKSNTVLGSGGGGLISYKSKIQTQDFQFGMNPEPEITYGMPDREPEFQEEPDNLDLLPADDNDLHDFSSEAGKADMLF